VRRYSSAATTTTASRPCTVIRWGPSLFAFRTSSLSRAFASLSAQWPLRSTQLTRRLPILVIWTIIRSARSSWPGSRRRRGRHRDPEGPARVHGSVAGSTATTLPTRSSTGSNARSDACDVLGRPTRWPGFVLRLHQAVGEQEQARRIVTTGSWPPLGPSAEGGRAPLSGPAVKG